MFSGLAAAIAAIREGVRLAPLWSSLGWEQTLSRFRRTVLGPFWLSANLLAISFSLAVVFGGLLGTNYRATFAQTITGILTWSLLGGAYGEAPLIFISGTGMMTSQRLPLSFYIFLMMYRIMINFVAQLITLWAVLAIMRLGSPPSIELLVGLPILVCTSFCMSLVIAIPATRYRDFGQLVGNLVSLMFFLTPVFWVPVQMSRRQQFLVTYNPLAHLLEIVREPLLGRAPAPVHWVWSIATLGAVATLAILLLALYRKRVVFWL